MNPEELKKVLTTGTIRRYTFGKNGAMGDYLIEEDMPEEDEEEPDEI